TSWKSARTSSPSVKTTTEIASATPAAINAYSIAVAPASSLGQMEVRQFTADLSESIFKVTLGWGVVILVGVRSAVLIERTGGGVQRVRKSNRIDGDAKRLGVVAHLGQAVIGLGQHPGTAGRAHDVCID